MNLNNRLKKLEARRAWQVKRPPDIILSFVRSDGICSKKMLVRPGVGNWLCDEGGNPITAPAS